jgi:hypothetical protein
MWITILAMINPHLTSPPISFAQAHSWVERRPSFRLIPHWTRLLLKNKERFDYATALANGWPIATGIIEGACRHLVKDRMDLTGARWSLDGAEAVLRLRSLRTSGDFEEYMAFHHRQERQRNYGLAPQNKDIKLAA